MFGKIIVNGFGQKKRSHVQLFATTISKNTMRHWQKNNKTLAETQVDINNQWGRYQQKKGVGISSNTSTHCK